jgi:hypothetical protein
MEIKPETTRAYFLQCPSQTGKCYATLLQLETQLRTIMPYQQFDEKIEHIISSCPILAKEQYLKRNDRVCAKL